MKFKVILSTVDFATSVPLPRFPPFRLMNSLRDRTASVDVLSTSFVSKNPLKSHSFSKISRCCRVRRSCSSNLGEIDPESSSLHEEGLAENRGRMGREEAESRVNKNGAISERTSFVGRDQSSFSDSRFDFLEPMMLGIRPEFDDRLDQETVVWATVEQKAKSLGIPLSLRMIKKKLQCEEGFIEPKESVYCSVKAAFASMVFIIVELQSYALQMREALCHEDLEVIITKVQKEMNSSFVWLFEQVFSKTPTLMLYVMILLANFTVYSASDYCAAAAVVETSQSVVVSESTTDTLSSNEEKRLILASSSGEGIVGKMQIGHQFNSLVEMNLWNSMVDEATKMQEGIKDDALNPETTRHFVSPVFIELEPDLYEDYSRTDLLYQIYLSFEPDDPLLLCNYAQFLHLVAHDYDRAEECFKRAVQIPPPDAQCLSLYANFLWTVRRDVWAAEERFLQALAAEPENSYYTSRYTIFLWTSGDEEACFPPSKTQNPNL